MWDNRNRAESFIVFRLLNDCPGKLAFDNEDITQRELVMVIGTDLPWWNRIEGKTQFVLVVYSGWRPMHD